MNWSGTGTWYARCNLEVLCGPCCFIIQETKTHSACYTCKASKMSRLGRTCVPEHHSRHEAWKRLCVIFYRSLAFWWTMRDCLLWLHPQWSWVPATLHSDRSCLSLPRSEIFPSALLQRPSQTDWNLIGLTWSGPKNGLSFAWTLFCLLLVQCSWQERYTSM